MQLQSENINELMSALAKAQGQMSAHQESKIIPSLVKTMRGPIHPGHKFGVGVIEKFLCKIAFGLSDCWYWTGALDMGGYGSVMCKSIGESRAHRMSWKIFNGKIPEGKKVLHRCDVRNCVNPEHLFLGTQKDNVLDMFKKGRANRRRMCGEENSVHKLSNQQVLVMRKEYAEGNLSYKSISKKYGVSAMTAYRAITKKCWSHI